MVEPRRLRDEAARLGVAVPAEAARILCELASRVLQENAALGLTAIDDDEAFLEKHILDSISLLAVEPVAAGESVCDLGSGAGFPGLPVALLCPAARVVLVEASGRRAAFLRRVVQELGLGVGVAVVQARAEDLGRDPAHRGRHDAVVARAVAPLAVLVELALPLLRVGGRLMAMKGPRAGDEVEEAAAALAAVGGEVEAEHGLVLPVSGAVRRIVRVVKRRETPETYPRRSGVPARRPLGVPRQGRKDQEPRGSGRTGVRARED